LTQNRPAVPAPLNGRAKLETRRVEITLVLCNGQRVTDMTSDPTSVPILIVDDDEPTQNLLRAVLRRCGYTSEIAANGRQAIDLLTSRRYAGVVLDMMMPEVSGYAVVDFLSNEPHPVPVIVCSAAGPTALTGFDTAVVKAVVRKPFDVDELTAAITSIFVG
jgi:CheY-like chemotaxis protein